MNFHMKNRCQFMLETNYFNIRDVSGSNHSVKSNCTIASRQTTVSRVQKCLARIPWIDQLEYDLECYISVLWLSNSKVSHRFWILNISRQRSALDRCENELEPAPMWRRIFCLTWQFWIFFRKKIIKNISSTKKVRALRRHTCLNSAHFDLAALKVRFCCAFWPFLEW